MHAVAAHRIALVLAVVTIGCEPRAPAAYPFHLELFAQDDRGQALSGVAFSLQKVEVGTTDESGRLALELTAPEGHGAEVEAVCPGGHDNRVRREPIVFRRLRGLDGRADPRRLVVSITCSRTHRLAALIVNAEGRSGLPVFVDGIRQGTTDDSGVFHLALVREPGAAFRVALDTSGQARLSPKNPARDFEVADRDDFYVFEQHFAEHKPRRTRRNNKRAEPVPEAPEEPSPPRRPVRID